MDVEIMHLVILVFFFVYFISEFMNIRTKSDEHVVRFFLRKPTSQRVRTNLETISIPMNKYTSISYLQNVELLP